MPTTQAGAAKVATINATIAKQGQAAPNVSVAPKTTSTPAPTPVVNPHDAPGYNPATDPTSSAYGKTVAPVTPTVNTTQPSPATAPVQPPNGTVSNANNPDLAAAIAGNGGALSDAQMADPNSIQGLAQKYKAGLANAQNSGKTVPNTTGGGMSGVKDNIPTPVPATPTYDSTQTDAVLADNKAHQQYITDYTNSQSSQAQTESLTQTYTDLSAQLGIPAMNTELMNMKNIMDGTEQDIRDEITKAGGFASNSQVLALTTARNKGVVTNYNNLLTARDDAMKNLTTMVDLTEKDRTYAQQKIDSQLNFDKQNIDYADKALTNAQDALKTMQGSEGWDGIYKAALATGDPQAIQKINSTMGNGFDLATMAQQDATDRATKNETTALDQAQKQATLTNTEATTANTRATTAKTTAETQALNTTTGVTTGSGTPYNSDYKSPTDYVNAILTKQGVSYQTAQANTPVGYVSAVDNSTGQTVLLNAKDWKSNGSSYTPIYNNI